MGKLTGMPATCRAKAYDYCGTTWRNIAANVSGEVIVANGETLLTAATVIATAASGGQVLGSGTIERVIIGVPLQHCSGGSAYWGYSGEGTAGIWIGGRS